MAAENDGDIQNLRHLHALRNFIGNLVEQAEKSGGCECHKPPSLLLVGPPGAGKTYLVKQMSKVCDMPLFGVHTHHVKSAADIKKLFTQARENYPSLVFLDDVDTIFANHERDRSCTPDVQQIREEIFMELGPRKLKIHDPESAHNPTQQQVQGSPGSGSSRASSCSSTLSRPRPSAPELNDSYDESLYPDNNGIIVVAATSEPWMLYKDHELLSRFRGVYLVGLPDKDARYTLLQTLLRELHHSLSDQDIMEIAEKTHGFTPADLMVVMKTLSYRQFSFLLSMTNGREGGGSQDNSCSASPTPTSSDLTETGSETDIDGLSEPKNKQRAPGAEGGTISTTGATVAALAAAAAVAAASKTNGGPRGDQPPPKAPRVAAGTSGIPPATSESPPAGGEGLLSRAAAAGVVVAAMGAAAASVSALQRDWSSDSEEDEEGGLVTQRERVAGGVDSVSPDSGMILSRSSEEAIPRLDQPDGRVTAVVGPSDAASDDSPSPRLQQPVNSSPVCNQQHESSDDSESSGDRTADAQHDQSGPVSEVHREHEEPNNSQAEDLDDSREHSDVFHPNNSTDHYDYPASDAAGAADGSSVHGGGGSSSSSPLHGEQPALHNSHELTNGDASSSPSSSPRSSTGENIYNHETSDGDVVDATGCNETEEVVVHPEYKNAPSPAASAGAPSSVNTDEAASSVGDRSVDCDEEAAVVELHYTEPPEPMRDDNLAVDSDSDNESPMMRPRRVGFASRPVAIDPMTAAGDSGFSSGGGGRPPAMSPLSVDCGGDRPPNISLDVMAGSGALNNGANDNILRQLLSRPAHGNNNGGCSPTPPASPTPSHCSSGAATLASSGSGRGSPQHMGHHSQEMHHHSPLHQGADMGAPTHAMALQQQHQTSPHHSATRHRHQSPHHSSPLHQSPHHQSPHHQSPHHQSPHHQSPHHQSPHHQSPHLQSPHHQSPHHSSPHHSSPHIQSPHHQSPHIQSPHHQSPHLSSSHHQSPHLHHNGMKGDGDKQQQQQQQQQGVDVEPANESLGLKVVTGLGAAAAAATVTPSLGNGPEMPGVTEDDMAKLVDALEQHLDGGAVAGGSRRVAASDGGSSGEDSEEEDSCSEDEHDDEKAAMMAIEGMGNVGIQRITLADVLEVIDKGYRTVSDEEIKKYTNFMLWFANVAKSACPHNNGRGSEAASMDEDDECAESTLCATPSLLKRNQRRKPLKKLGKFLLKALMFILD